MASDDDSQSSEPCIISMDKAAIERKRAALFDKVLQLSPKAIENGINRHEHSDKKKGKANRADNT